MNIARVTATVGLKLTLVASICAFASLSSAGTAEAGHSIDINFSTDGQNFFPGPAPSNSYAFGHIEAGPIPCRRDRVFRLFKNSEPGILIDTDHSSHNGFFALGGDLSGASVVVIRMARKRFGRRGNRHTCEADSNTFNL